MNLKSFFSSLFYSLVLCSLLIVPQIFTDFSFNSADFAMPNGGLMQMPSEEEIAEIEKFLATLSEEDLNQLAKLGEEIIKTAEKEGVPLFAPTPEGSATSKVPEATPQGQKNPIYTEPTGSNKAAEEAILVTENVATKATLASLIEIIEEIRKKASHEPLLHDTIVPFDKDINTLLFYLYVIQNKNLIRYFELPEFKSIKEKLIAFHRDLDAYNRQFIVPEKNMIFNPLKKTDKRDRKLLKSASGTIRTIIERFQRAFTQETILSELEKIIKKYEPDALKIKDQIKASEKTAFDYISKIPVTNSSTAPKNIPGGGLYNTPANTKPGGNNFVTPGATSSKKEDKNNNQLANKTKEKEVQKKNDKNGSKQPVSGAKKTAADYETAIKEYFDKTENYITTSYNKISSFVDSYTPNGNLDVIQEDFENINHYLKKLRAYTKRWEDMIFSQADNAEEKRQQKSTIANLFKDEKQHQKIKALHAKTKEFADKKISLKGPLQTFKQYMDSIEQLITN